MDIKKTLTEQDLRIQKLEAIIFKHTKMGERALQLEEFRGTIKEAIFSTYTNDERYIKGFVSNAALTETVVKITGMENNATLKKNIGMILTEAGVEGKHAKINNKMQRGYLLANRIK